MTHPENPSEVAISVIMIAYNQERTIDEAIRGVMLQRTSVPFELIVADDASTDSTVERIRRWQERYPERIRLIARPANLGMAPNYLDAYAHCRGRYVAICEGDDWWCSSRKLERQYAYMEAHQECALCCHRVVNYYADKHTLSLSNGGLREGRYTLADLARGNFITNLSVMYRAIPASELPQWVSEIKLFDYAMHSLHAERGHIYYMSSPMAVYRQYAAGTWSGSATRRLRLAMDVRECLMRHFAGRPDIVALYLKAYTDIALTLYLNTDQTDRSSVARRLTEMLAEAGRSQESALDVAEMAEERRAVIASSQRPLPKRLLSSLRAMVTLLLPLPRIYRALP